MNERTLQLIKLITKKAGFGGEVTQENAESVVISLAENQPEFLAGEIEKIYKRAVNAYTSRGDAGDKFYTAESDAADVIFEILKIKVDYPGLYPSFIIVRGEDTMNEYSALNAIRQYNNFWNHWKK